MFVYGSLGKAKVLVFCACLGRVNGEIWLPLPSFVACEVVENEGGD